MKTIKEAYELFDQIGACSFSTPNEFGGVDTRIAHFFAYGEEGLYLRTMTVKPFYKQLVESGKLAVCGERTSERIKHDENNLPLFQPGIMMRVTGEVRLLSLDEVKEIAAKDENFNVAVHDISKYPETRVFVLSKAWGECYNYDYKMLTRDHKLLRDRFAWGGATFEEPGLRIDEDKCIGCGKCFDVCSFRAIVPGETHSIRGERCDECGNCYNVCPSNAILHKGIGRTA